VLTRWVSFEQEGQYSVSILAPGAQNPAVIAVEVLPRNARRLEEICRSLVAQPERELALNELSSMRDPVAIQHLVEMKNTWVPDPLAAMDTVEAMAALEDLARDRDPKLASRSREALSQVKSRTKNDAVRQRADAALSRLH
jgi:hypothetical protein